MIRILSMNIDLIQSNISVDLDLLLLVRILVKNLYEML